MDSYIPISLNMLSIVVLLCHNLYCLIMGSSSCKLGRWIFTISEISYVLSSPHRLCDRCATQDKQLLSSPPINLYHKVQQLLDIFELHVYTFINLSLFTIVLIQWCKQNVNTHLRYFNYVNGSAMHYLLIHRTDSPYHAQCSCSVWPWYCIFRYLWMSSNKKKLDQTRFIHFRFHFKRTVLW